jgi:hypothetical protein
MKPSLRTRKPIDKLSLVDIEAFPVWEFVTDEEGVEGEDETWVRPVDAQEAPGEAFSLSVAAAFKAPSGEHYRGIVGVTTFGEIEIGHAAILTKDKYVFIPSPGYADAIDSGRAAARELGLSERELFPLEYELSVRVQGESVRRKGFYSIAVTGRGDR